jgi:iron(III) transport system substrate-binding protein
MRQVNPDGEIPVSKETCMRYFECIFCNLRLRARTLVIALLLIFPVSAPANGQTEWEKALSAAKKEGRVAVAGGYGEVFRQAQTAFQQAFPEIKLEFSGGRGFEWGRKIPAEQEVGKYLWDVYASSADTPVGVLKPRGAFDPLRSALILPEVLDDSKWLGGFDDGWMDKEKQFIYAFGGKLSLHVLVNREFI